MKTEIPSEIQLLPFGMTRTEKGDFLLDEESAKAVVADFTARKNDMVIDYEHQTLSGEEAPAAGWVKGLIDKGAEGIWALVDWTEKAKGYLENREYRYLSPVFLKRVSDNRVVRLLNAGLTNQPAIDGMVAVVNKAKAFDFNGLDDGYIDERKEGRNMRELVKVLGLADEATESEVTATLHALKQSALRGERAEELEAEVVALKAELSRLNAVGLVAGAMKDGKITPAQRTWAVDYADRDPQGFALFVAKSPAVVPVGQSLAGEHRARNLATADGLQGAVNAMLGVSIESFKRQN